MSSITLSSGEIERLNILLRFLEITREGMVRPHDPTAIIDKLEKQGLEIPPADRLGDSTITRDAKYYKPYVKAALNKISEILELDVRDYSRRFEK